MAEEMKSKRLRILIKPSIYEKVSKIAFINDIPLSSIINDLLEKYVIEHQEDINCFDLAVAIRFIEDFQDSEQ